MNLPAHTRERIAEIRSLHIPIPVWVPTSILGWLPWMRRIEACVLCRMTYPCGQINWADDVEAGRVSPAGWRR